MTQRRIRGLHELIRFVGPSLALRPVFTLAISILIARTLGPEGRGAYAVAANMLAVLPMMCQLGLQPATRYWSARGEVDSGSLLRTITATALVLGLLTGSIGLVCIMRRSPSWLVPDTLGLAGSAGLGRRIARELGRGATPKPILALLGEVFASLQGTSPIRLRGLCGFSSVCEGTWALIRYDSVIARSNVGRVRGTYHRAK